MFNVAVPFLFHSIETLDTKFGPDFCQSNPRFAYPWDGVGFLGNFRGQFSVPSHLLEEPDSHWRCLVCIYQLVNVVREYGHSLV